MFRLFRRARGHCDPLEAQAAQRRGVVLVDVRTAHGWCLGARVARRLPLNPLPARTLRLPAQAEVHVICASRHRPRAAARLYCRMRFTTVYVRGGTAA
jgi:rhodanese-related sulfurtransferase